MLKLVVAAIAVVVLFAIAAVAIASWRFRGEIDRDVQRLIADARGAIPATVTESMLADLPASAQRYFRFAGVVGRAVPRLVRITQTGRIRSSNQAGWMSFEAEETYSTSPPAFVWRAFMPSQSMPVVFGRDEYVDGHSSILMKAGGLIAVAAEQGEALGAAGLMRYLNEAMWFPAALLLPNVSIAGIDKDSFNVRIVDRGVSAEATLFIDADGRLTNFRARRYNTTTRSMETWETPIGKYGAFNGLNVPVQGAAVWKLAGGDLDYIELVVSSIAYQ